ncbi:MAG: transcription antitermination factor NusB [Gammaproteobacteria bacterium]|nr:MAG: transcription antitermination factor NusB [Gammaproteobacteria bacterium]
MPALPDRTVSEGRVSYRARSRARRCLLQALYQWQLTGGEVRDVINQFLEGSEIRGADRDYFTTLMLAIGESVDELDRELEPLMDRSPERLDPVEHAALWIGAHELLHHPEVPLRVVINEAVELAKTFGGEQGHGFVNAVLDRLGARVRQLEAGVR